MCKYNNLKEEYRGLEDEYLTYLNDYSEDIDDIELKIDHNLNYWKVKIINKLKYIYKYPYKTIKHMIKNIERWD